MEGGQNLEYRTRIMDAYAKSSARRLVSEYFCPGGSITSETVKRLFNSSVKAASRKREILP